MAKEKISSDKQHKTFVKAAHDLGCDMTEDTFSKTLKDIASVKPMTQAQVKKKAKKGKK